jgi:hypothetical protein
MLTNVNLYSNLSLLISYYMLNIMIFSTNFEVVKIILKGHFKINYYLYYYLINYLIHFYLNYCKFNQYIFKKFISILSKIHPEIIKF